MRILILGATGMLGYSLFSNLREINGYDVFGTVRSIKGKESFFEDSLTSLIFDVDVSEICQIEEVIKSVKPDIVINCVGLIKQHSISKQYINAIEINALLPHQIANVCDKYAAKLIHFSTDCVFSGGDGAYTEDSITDATDLYGKSKCLGEVDYAPHITLRTSIIGHELTTSVSLVDWFLSQTDEVNGFSKAIFSGLPTAYMAKVLTEKIIPESDLFGLYHLSVKPIDKYSLLNIISDKYSKDIVINKKSDLVIDRSLSSKKLNDRLNLTHPEWAELVEYMHKDYVNRYQA